MKSKHSFYAKELKNIDMTPGKPITLSPELENYLKAKVKSLENILFLRKNEREVMITCLVEEEFFEKEKEIQDIMKRFSHNKNFQEYYQKKQNEIEEEKRAKIDATFGLNINSERDIGFKKLKKDLLAILSRASQVTQQKNPQEILFTTRSLPEGIQADITKYVQEEVDKQVKKAGFAPNDLVVIENCIQNDKQIPPEYESKLKDLCKQFAKDYPKLYSLQKINEYFEKLKEYSLKKVIEKKVNHIPKGEVGSDKVIMSNGLSGKEKLSIVDIIEFQIKGEKTADQETLLKKISYNIQLTTRELEMVENYLVAYAKYASTKNDYSTDLQKRTYNDLVGFLQDTKKRSYVKKMLKQEIVTILRIQNKKQGLPKQIIENREHKKEDIVVSTSLLGVVKENVQKLMTIYKEEKENWNKGLHEVLKEKTREEQMGIIYAILTRIYKSPEYTILRNTFIDMTTVDDLGIWLGILLFYSRGFGVHDESEKNIVLNMISKVGWQEAKQLLDMYNQESSPLLGKGKEIIEFLKPVLEYISKGNQMNQESIKITLEKSYKTFKSAEMKTLFEVKRRVYDEKIKFVDRVKNKLNNGIEVFKEEFSDYISQKDIQEGVKETVYLMSFVHDNPEIGNVLTTLGIKKDMFTIFDETNIAILVGMIAYYNQVVLGANTGRITVLYYLFQNMKKEKVKELMQNIDYMVENKKNTRDLKRSMCRALMNYCLKTHQTSRESSGINTERMVESEMNYNGTDYMNRLDREHEENNSDTRNIGNEENYIQWIVSTYKEKNQIFSQQMFTGFDEQVIDLLDTIWEIDRGIYYEIVEDLLKSQEYASEHNGNESSEVSIANANNLKEVIALLTKKCPSPKALRGIAQVSMDIKESEEIFAQGVDFESKEDEDITKLKKYVSEENKHFGKVSPEDLEFNQGIFGDEEL